MHLCKTSLVRTVYTVINIKRGIFKTSLKWFSVQFSRRWDRHQQQKNSHVHWIKRMLALRSLASSTPTMFLFCTRYCYSDDDLSSYTGLVRLAFLFLSSLWWWRSLRMCTSDPRLFSVIVEITEFLVMPLELVEIRFLRNMLLMRYFTPLLKLSFNPPYRTGFKALLVYNNVTAAK